MKKILKIIFEIVFIFIVWNIYLSLYGRVQAAGLSVSSSTVNIGETTSISVSIPSGYVAYEGTVSYDTGKLSSTGSSGTIRVADANFNLEQVSNFSVSFTAIGEGSASVSVNLTLVSSDERTESASGSGIITVKGNPAPASEPSSDATSNTQTSEPELNFTPVNETVYATQSMNVRGSWSKNSNKVGFLNKGQAVTRTGMASNGWSRIIYNGNVAYVASSLVSTTNPEDENNEEVNSEENSEEEEVQEPEQEVEEPENNDEEIYQNIVSKVGTIPEVGKNYNIYLFIGVCIVSIISFIFIMKKNISK